MKGNLPTITVTKGMVVATARYRAALQFGAPHAWMVYYERALAKAVADRIAQAVPDGPVAVAAAERVRLSIERDRVRDAEWRRRFMPHAKDSGRGSP